MYVSNLEYSELMARGEYINLPPCWLAATDCACGQGAAQDLINVEVVILC